MADVYAQTMEQIALVDRLGLDLVWFSEHHFVEDGFLPNFVPVAAAAAARDVTHPHRHEHRPHPVRPPATPGRGHGHPRPTVQRADGARPRPRLRPARVRRVRHAPPRTRVSYTEESDGIMRLAWQDGERFSYHGKR